MWSLVEELKRRSCHVKLLAMEKLWKSDMSWPSSVPFNLQCSFRATVWCISDDGLMEVLIAWALQATEIIHRSKVTQEELRYEGRVIFFLSGRLVNVTWLSDIHPSCWIMLVTGLETAMCWFVIQTDKLNSSVQVCLAGSLHDYVTLLQVHNSPLISMMGFLILCRAYSLFLLSFCKEKNKPWQEHSDTKCSLPCISDSLQCSFFLCVTSQYSEIYTVNDFQ